nr:PHB depolymerase family esterase [Micromonospora sp. DSM 115978]
MKHRRLAVLSSAVVVALLAAVSWAVVVPTKASAAVGFSEVSQFGSNPGNLRMFTYVPASSPANAPVVVLFHGCGGSASGLDTATGWRKYADTYGFTLVMPEQKPENVGSGGIVPHTCFSAWNPVDRTRAGQGEAASVVQMVNY